MVAVKIIEIPIQFSRNLPKIAIQFQPESDSNTHWGKTVSIQLLDKTTNQQSWSYTHLLQPTNTLHFTGVDYGRYQLQITPATPDTTYPSFKSHRYILKTQVTQDTSIHRTRYIRDKLHKIQDTQHS